MSVINLPDWKLANHTSLQCSAHRCILIRSHVVEINLSFPLRALKYESHTNLIIERNDFRNH
jgi:hypothetical protein